MLVVLSRTLVEYTHFMTCSSQLGAILVHFVLQPVWPPVIHVKVLVYISVSNFFPHVNLSMPYHYVVIF